MGWKYYHTACTLLDSSNTLLHASKRNVRVKVSLEQAMKAQRGVEI